MLNQATTICVAHLSPCNLTHWGQNGLGSRRKSSIVHISWSFIFENKTKKNKSGHSPAMIYVFPTRHPSLPDFYYNGGSQSSSNKVFPTFCREGRKPLGDQVPMAVGPGARPPSRTTTPRFRLQPTLKDQWQRGWRGRNLPTAEPKLHHPPWLLIRVAATRRQGWREEPLRLKPGQPAGAGCLREVRKRHPNKLLLDAGNLAALFLFFKCGHG